MLPLPKPRSTGNVRNTVTTIFNVILKPPMQKSCLFPLPKHPRKKRDPQCMCKQNIDHVRTIA